MKVECKYCGEYVEREEAYRRGLSSYCDWNHFLEKKREDQRAAAKRAAQSESVLPPQVRTSVLIRDKVCQLCGTNRDLHVHHIIYRSEGGTHDESNLITLCNDDHGLVHSDKQKFQPMLLKLIDLMDL